jgi:hypothetical protein
MGTMGLPYDVLCDDSPDVAEWADVCDKVAEERLEFASASVTGPGAGLQRRRIINALQDLKQVVHLIGPYIDQRSGAAYAISLLLK